MSKENVEVVRGLWSAYETAGVHAASTYYADDCTLEDLPDLPDGQTYVGGAGLRERYRQFVETWGDFTIEAVEFIDGDDDVVVVAAITARGPGSGLPLGGQLALAYEVRDGKIVRDRVFPSRGEALRAVGLE